MTFPWLFPNFPDFPWLPWSSGNPACNFIHLFHFIGFFLYPLKSTGFLMFSGGIERDQCHEMAQKRDSNRAPRNNSLRQRGMRNDLDLDFFAALGLFAIGTIINSTLLKEDSITNFSSKIAGFFMNVLCKFNLRPVSMGFNTYRSQFSKISNSLQLKRVARWFLFQLSVLWHKHPECTYNESFVIHFLFRHQASSK